MLARVIQLLPFHASTSKAVMPYWVKVSVSVGSMGLVKLSWTV